MESVAHGFGFRPMGRFAAYDHGLFGESPSATSCHATGSACRPPRPRGGLRVTGAARSATSSILPGRQGLDFIPSVLKPGLYDDLLTDRLELEVRRLRDQGLTVFFGKIEGSLLPDYLTRFLSARLAQAFRSFGDEALPRQVALANAVLKAVAEGDESLSYLLQEKIALEDQRDRLEEIRNEPSGPTIRPITELSSSALLTGAPGLPQLGREIERELASADTCEMLVAFVKTGGVRLIREPLRAFTARGGKLRLITTSYLGASDPAAVEELASLPNTEVRISYDTQAARLHAKAYFFHRESGLSTAYVGSANLSQVAMTSGLEWTVKFAARELPDLFRRCAAEFAGYWENTAFEPYVAGMPERFREAIRKERGDSTGGASPLVLFDLEPYGFQQEILESLQVARESRGHCRNLVVAATGTGKTMVAAFDYREFARKHGRLPSLLYVAHRKEILQQSLVSFRQVLRDGNFGGLLVDGEMPLSMDHVFCSIQSFVSKRLHEVEGADRWDFVVLDEAHHVEAKSYDQILDAMAPKVLLGLTATPERTDGTSVARHFDRPLASEIRLPDALQNGLLCPFHYFAISDPTADFSRLSWRSGRYDERELGELISGNTLRAQLVIDKLCEYLPDPYGSGDFDRRAVRGIGFCAGIDHAKFMARCFADAGIPSMALTSETAGSEREAMRGDLAAGRINFIFAVDVFNEGVDIPVVNCVLFLRPTESHVVYLQQLGRGLRKSKGKECLTVLDFVGQCRREFRYDLRFASILPGKRHRLIDEIERGFPHLPGGCAIVMERQAREVILESVRQTYLRPEHRIRDAFSEWEEGSAPTFSEFIERTGEDPLEMLRRRSWSSWKALAAGTRLPEDPDLTTSKLHLVLARTAMQRAPRYLGWLQRLASADGTELESLSMSPMAQQAYQLLWGKPATSLGFQSLADAFRRLRENRTWIEDLSEVLDWSRLRAHAERPLLNQIPSTLEIHGVYSALEINAAFGTTTMNGGGSRGTGVVPFHDHKVVVHLVTFEKTERQFSESTMYRDFPTRPDLLHWESQSLATQTSKLGKIYANHEALGYRILFFTRIRKEAGPGLTSPFLFLGCGRFIDATGERPIAIRWQLEQPMPMEHFREARIVCGLDP